MAQGIRARLRELVLPPEATESGLPLAVTDKVCGIEATVSETSALPAAGASHHSWPSRSA